MKTAWIKSFLNAGLSILPCTVLLTATLLASSARADITGAAPWACYTFNGNDTNTGDGRRTWNGGSFTYSVTGAAGEASSNVSATGSRWTSTGNCSIANGGTFSFMAKENGSNENGILFALAAKGADGKSQWVVKRGSASGKIKIGGLFTSEVELTAMAEAFHHLVVTIAADQTVKIYLDGEEQTSITGTLAEPVKEMAFHGYQVNGTWGGNTNGPPDGVTCVAGSWLVDDLRIYDEVLTADQIAALNTQLRVMPESYEPRSISGTDALWSATGAWTKAGTSTTVDAPVSGSSVTLSAAAAATLTMNVDTYMDAVTVEGTGPLTLATDSEANRLRAGTLTMNTDATIQSGAATVDSVSIATEKTVTVSNPAEISSSFVRAASAKLKITGNLNGTQNVLMLHNDAVTETTGNVVITDGITETLKGRTWILSGGVSSTPHLYLAAGADWGSPGNRSFLTLQEGAQLTVTGTASTIGRNKTDGAMMFSECGNGSTVTVTGANTALKIPNGALNLSRDGSTTATVSNGALLQAYKLGGTDQTNSTLTIQNATLTLGKDGATDGELRMPTAKLILNNATLSAAGDWFVGTATADGKIEVANALTITPNGKTITLRKMTFQDGATVALQGSGTVDAREVSEYTGTYTVSDTTKLILSAETEASTTVGGGATLELILSDELVATGYTCQAALDSGATLILKDSAGNTLTHENGTYTPPAPRLTLTDANAADFTAAWSDLANWSSTTSIPTGGSIIIDYSAVTTNPNITIPAAAEGSAWERVTLSGGENTHYISVTLAEGATVPAFLLSGHAEFPVALVNDAAVTFTVAEGKKLIAKVDTAFTLTKAITIDGIFAKSGAEALTLNAAVTPNGGSQVLTGTLKFGTATQGGSSYGSWGDIIVSDGATLDLNGRNGSFTRTVTLGSDSKLLNTGSNIAADQRLFQNITLTGNATIGGTGNFGLIASGWGATTLTLNGHTLKKEGTNGFWLCRATVDTGTLDIQGGRIAFENNYASNIGDITVKLAEGAQLQRTNGTINWNGSFTKDGPGPWTAFGNFSANPLTVKDGTLTLQSTRNVTAGDVVIDPGAVLDASHANARLFATGEQVSTPTVTVRGTLKLANLAWGENASLGKLANDSARLILDGGLLELTSGGSIARAYTITEEDATIRLPENGTYTYTGADSTALTFDTGAVLTVAGNNSIFVPNGTGTAATLGAVKITNGVTLKRGTNEVTFGALEMEAESILDVTAGPLKVSGNLTLPTDGAVTVLFPEGATIGTEILHCANADELNFDFFSLAPPGLDYTADGNVVKLKEAEVDPYEVATATYGTLKAALAGGVFGTGATTYPGNSNLIIDFGDIPAGGVATPGSFELDDTAAFSMITVKGSNGGSVTLKDGCTVSAVQIVAETDAEFPIAVAQTAQRMDLESGCFTLVVPAQGNAVVEFAVPAIGEGQLGFTTVDATDRVKITAENEHTGGTVVNANTTIIAVPTSINGLGAVSGAGTVQLTGDAFINLNLSRFADSETTLEVAAGETAQGYLNNGIYTVAAKINLLGTLHLNEGASAGRYTFTGPLTGGGTLQLSSNVADAFRFTESISGFTGTLNVGGKRAIVFCAAGTDNAQKYSGRIHVHQDYAHVAQVVGTWTGTVSVGPNAQIGGTGTVNGTLTLENNAILVASTAGALKLAAGRTLTLADRFTVQFPAETAITSSVTVLDRADTSALDLTGKTITVKVGDTVDSLLIAEASAEGDLIVRPIEMYEAEITENTAWDNLTWTVNGATVTSRPGEHDRVRLKPQAEGLVVTCAAPLEMLSLDTVDYPVTLRFAADVVTQEMYESIPTSVTLITTVEGLNKNVMAQMATLKYGAFSSITATETSAVAEITLPESAQTSTQELISISFAKNSDSQIGDSDITGLAGYETLGTNWKRVTGGALTVFADSCFSVPLADRQTAGATQTDFGAGSLAYIRHQNNHDGYFFLNSTNFPVLKGYIDDSGASAVTITLPTEIAAAGYTVILYASTDAANVQFTHFTVNETNYTAVDGVTTEGTSSWGNSGPANSSAGELAEGTNVLVIRNQTNAILSISENGPSGGARGGLAGVQVLIGTTEYELLSTVHAVASAADADTVVAWTDLTWVDEDGNPVSAPDATQVATITLESDVTLDLTGAAAKRVQVVGYGHRMRVVPGTASEALPFLFSEDTVYRMKEPGDLLPNTVEQMPGEVRYEYFYDASTTAYTTLPETVSNFTAGFAGRFVPAGGGIEFSAGNVTLSSMAPSSTTTTIAFTGTSRSTLNGGLLIGQEEVYLSDSAVVTTPKLSLSESGEGWPQPTSFLTLEDSAQLAVTGAVNIHDGAGSNSSSVKLAHWPGTAYVSLRDRAKLLAEQADVILAYDGSATLTIEDEAEARFKGLVHYNKGNRTSTVNLDGGQLFLGETAVKTVSTSDTRQIRLNLNGGSLGALSGTVTLGAAEQNALVVTKLNDAVSRFASKPNAVLHLPQAGSLLTGTLTNLSGGLRIGEATLDDIVLESGSLEVTGAVSGEMLSVGDEATVICDGGVLTVAACNFEGNASLQVPLRSLLTEGGYIVLRDAATLPDVSKVSFSFVLDADRADADRLLPEYPVIVGSYDAALDETEPNVRGLGLSNSNNAVDAPVLRYTAGDLGQGIYAQLTGDDVLGQHNAILNITTGNGYELRQSVADANPYHYFISTVEGARLSFPNGPIALSHATFTGLLARILAPEPSMTPFLQCNAVAVTGDVVFDLSAWADEMNAFVRGAVQDVPVSQCLISGGITVAPGVSMTVDFGTSFTVPEGFEVTVEAGANGLYLVARADRPTATVSVNVTNVTTDLTAPPAAPGLYPVAVEAWNDLKSVFVTSELKQTDLGGVAATTATSAADASTPTYLQIGSSKLTTLDSAPTSMLKVWLTDAQEYVLRLKDLPFEAYRVALIFANDLGGAAYAPIQVGDDLYAMDAEGYTRKNIIPYVKTSPSSGRVTLEVAGDEAWGSTDQTSVAQPIVAGANALVTDVLTASELKVTFPAAVYGKTYAGLAALQILEAPAPQVMIEQTFEHTFATSGEFNLTDLQLTVNGTATSWSNGVKHTLVLRSDVPVTVTLPLNFVADTIQLSGDGAFTLKVANDGGAALNNLDAAMLAGDLTVHFPYVDRPFSAPEGVTTFEAAFNNNGAPYLIAEGATLVLGEKSGAVTIFDGAGTPTLTLDPDSRGTLRRNYTVQTGIWVEDWTRITMAFKNATHTANPDNGGSSLLVEEGDTLRYTGRVHLLTQHDWNYTQTGGSASFEHPMRDEGGLLIFNGGSSAGNTATVNVSGGRLFATMIWSWQTNSIVNINVSDEGTLALGSRGLRVQGSGARLSAVFSGNATLELMDSTLTVGGPDRVTTTFNGGRITTSQPEAVSSLPVDFAGTDATPTQLSSSSLATLVLEATNTGSGVVTIPQGKVAISNANALGETTATVKSGATFEVRELAADAAMTNTMTFEAGTTLSVVTSGSEKTFRIAGTLTLPTDLSTMTFFLNGTRYTDVTNNANGTITFGDNPVSIEAVTWGASDGVWEDGRDGPWLENKTYQNGAAVNFPSQTTKVNVTVSGEVKPGSVTFAASGAANKYHFTAATDKTSYVALPGTSVKMGSGQVWDVPVAVAANAVLGGSLNTYRLIGTLSNVAKSATLVGSDNINDVSTAHGAWCTEGVTLAPQAGEVQTLSAMGFVAEGEQSHLTGSENVTIMGAGTVRFAGRVGNPNNENKKPFQNKAFSGKIIVTDGGTLDFTMTRVGDGRENFSFFAQPRDYNGNTPDSEPYSAVPLWRSATEAGIQVKDRGTVRFSGCRTILGGFSNKDDADLLASFPLELGYQSTADYAYGTPAAPQVTPYGFRFIGDGARLLATNELWITGGTKWKVFGVGDMGDPADPKTCQTATEEFEAGVLMSGIDVEIAGSTTGGLIPWAQPNSANSPLTVDVGAGSTLTISAPVRTSTGSGSGSFLAFTKVNEGRVRFTAPTSDVNVQLNLTEGTMGGLTTFTNAASVLTASAGTTVESGLSIAQLMAADGVTFAIDPSGKTVLHAENFHFSANGVYPVRSMLAEAEIPEAAGRPAMKVLGWGSTRAAETVAFVLDPALIEKGYTLALRQDGLYLMEEIVYVRDLSTEITSGGEYRVTWFAPKTWYRSDDATKTKRDYDPAEDEAVTACFRLAPTFAEDSTALPTLVLLLDRETSFANVRVVAEVDAVDAEGNPVKVDKVLSVPVIYEYALTEEPMPGAGEAKRFTWVPTLVLTRETGIGLADIRVQVPQGYEYAKRDTTVMVYLAATQMALNLNFTADAAGGGSWIDETADPCGIVPFAGVYWNNLSSTVGDIQGNDLNHTMVQASALPAGVAADEHGQIPYCTVTYAFNKVTTVHARQTGDSDAMLTAGFLAGNRTVALSDTVRNMGGMTNAGVQAGWQVRVASVPFACYDLYLCLTGNAESSVTYPAIRVKVGDGAWKTYTMKNGWATRGNRNSTWQGLGALENGEFVDGGNVLHLRVQATEGAALEIAPWDNGQANDDLAAMVGLAALQIVDCAEGATLERLGNGKWSDSGGWRRTFSGGTETGKWMDATLEAPYYATIPMLQQFTADVTATTPYLAFTGSGNLLFEGSDGVVTTGAVDLSAVNAGSILTFGADLFAEPVNVLLAPDVTVRLPETVSGTTEIPWVWMLDDEANNVNSASATLHKRLAGEVVLKHGVPCNVQIDDGILWVEANTASTAVGNITGTAGTFGKKGPGALTFSGNLTHSGQHPLRISEGMFKMTKALTGIASGATVLVDGGTLDLPTSTGTTSGAYLVASDGGRVRVRGELTSAQRPRLTLRNGGLFENTEVNTGWSGYQVVTIDVEGPNNRIEMNQGGTGGSGITITGSLTVKSGATLQLEGTGTASLRCITGELKVEDGGTFISKKRVGVGSSGNYGVYADAAASAAMVLRKTGGGLWNIQTALAPKGDGDTPWGQALDVEAGEVQFAFGGGNYGVSESSPITVRSGAKVSGNVVFNANSPFTFKEGAIARNGLPGIANSKLTLHTATFEPGAIVEADLRLTNPLTISDSLTFGGGEITVNLINMPGTLSEEKQLIAWPVATAVGVEFTSPDAVTLDAKFEKRDTGLFLVPSNESYSRVDTNGNWSATGAWSYQNAAVDYPEISGVSETTTPFARLVANAADMNLTVDKGTLATADGYNWKAQALITVANSGRTLSLAQGATLDTATDSYAGLNGVLVWQDLWKLGAGTVDVAVPLSYRAVGDASTLNVNGGVLRLRRPLTTAQPKETGTSQSKIPTAVEIAQGATLEYALETTTAETKAINGKYEPLQQELTGAVTGKGTLRVTKADTTITLSGNTDNDVNLDVQAGNLVLKGTGTMAVQRATQRTVTVNAGAALELAGPHVMGGCSDIRWTLKPAEDLSARITTTAESRVRGQVTVAPADVSVPTEAIFGTVNAQLDNHFRVDVPASATLQMGGDWTAAAEINPEAVFVKAGAGVVALDNFGANLPVTVKAGTLVLGDSAVVTENTNNGAVKPTWVVEADATLALGGGNFTLSEGGSLTLAPEAVLAVGTHTTKVNTGVTLGDRTTLTFGKANTISVGRVDFTTTTVVDGIVMIDLDALDPATLQETSLTLISFAEGTRGGSGSFQLGGQKLVEWAENGWTLYDNGANEVILRPFGAEGYYTWAGDGTEGSTGNGNWANAFWVKNGEDAATAWPTVETPSVMLQDLNPLDHSEIPETARTLDWTMAEQTIEAFRVKNSQYHDYVIMSSNGSASFRVDGDFLKSGAGKVTVNRPLVLGRDAAIRLLGGETEIAGGLSATSGSFTKPVTVAGQDTILRFSGAASRSLLGLLEGDGEGTIAQSGSGTLTIGDAVDNLKALTIEKGSVRLTAADQYRVVPEVTLSSDASLVLAGSYVGAGTVEMQIHPDAAGTAGMLVWEAETSSSLDKAPRFGAPEGAVDPAITVETFKYQPTNGHLILDPDASIFKPGFNLVMQSGNDTPTSALWLGAYANAGDQLRVSGLSGTGVIGVEPVIDLLADPEWSSNRVLTVAATATDIAKMEAFEGAFMGAMTPSTGTISVGLDLVNPGIDAITRFRYSGSSNDAYLGTFSIGEKTAAEVLGAWAGDVAVQAGGRLMGSGTVGAVGREVSVPKGAILSATTYGQRIGANNTHTEEVIPTQLTVKGSLAMNSGSVLDVLIRKDARGDVWSSLVTTDTLELPVVLEDGSEEVELTVNVEMDEGLVFSDILILGWGNLNGSQKIGGTVNVTVNGQPVEGYELRKYSDGLHLVRSGAHFLLILQ